MQIALHLKLGVILIAGLALVTGVISAHPIGDQGRSDAATTAAFAVVDTNQVKCYNALNEIACPSTGAAFYGQDAQHTGQTSNYTNNNAGTVTDAVTILNAKHIFSN